MSNFSAVELIIQKREHGELSTEQIDWLIDGYTKGSVADEQMSSMAMAILLNGMNRREISDLTAAMIASGERLDFSALALPTSDKHSTGGVGDKITSITIHDDTTALFESQKDNLEHWNSILDR